jgi:GNAT superfamily N-acetyltransferase
MLLRFEVATPGAPLRAAAAVRAAAFAPPLPPDRSPWARAAFMRGRTGDAWAALEAKVAGTDPDWGGIRVVCLLATVGEGEGEEEEEDGREGGGWGGAASPASATVHLPALPPGLAAALGASTDPSCCLPATPATPRRWGVATLDLNFGPRLPSERLVADPPPPPPLPGGGGDGRRRGAGAGGGLAYLSNVSVAAPARRCGVGRALVAHALALSPGLGAVRCATHAATPAAGRLYCAAGFVAVAREAAAVARARGEAPRSLFVVDV